MLVSEDTDEDVYHDDYGKLDGNDDLDNPDDYDDHDDLDDLDDPEHKKHANPTIFKFATKQRNYISSLQKQHLFYDFIKHAHALDETLVHRLQIVLIACTNNYICANYTDDNYTIN